MRTKLLMIFAAAVVIGLPVLYLRYIFSRGELGSKPEWSTLQVAEAESQSEPPKTAIVLREKNGYHLLGVSSRSNGRRVWILLDPHADPFYKQMPPDDAFAITEDDLQQAASFCTVHPDTLAELKRRISVR